MVLNQFICFGNTRGNPKETEIAEMVLILKADDSIGKTMYEKFSRLKNVD